MKLDKTVRNVSWAKLVVVVVVVVSQCRYGNVVKMLLKVLVVNVKGNENEETMVGERVHVMKSMWDVATLARVGFKKPCSPMSISNHYKH